eukprot:CAMPEP_0172675048 /NCGR_PEP_ID=MMETSP1074-20121228/13061_1 /TAXON_ID=2916 /ORGANISM="Ceratium fusus, Strain PA161109" /LENGTH=219 /DNA_ID=CAMNT_0013492495 /DNA_START=239 /DNA_END=899 /DNA_ORIENTATION=+
MRKRVVKDKSLALCPCDRPLFRVGQHRAFAFTPVILQRTSSFYHCQLCPASSRRNCDGEVVCELTICVSLVEGHPTVMKQDAEQHMAPGVRPHFRRRFHKCTYHTEVLLTELFVEGAAAPKPHIDPCAVACNEPVKLRRVCTNASQVLSSVRMPPEGLDLLLNCLCVGVKPACHAELFTDASVHQTAFAVSDGWYHSEATIDCTASGGKFGCASEMAPT